MKKIILMRHAKSSWRSPSLTDHQRTLNERGNNDTPLIAQEISKRGILPELMLVSDAQRTKETWEHLTKSWGSIPTKFSNNLYLASADTLISELSQTSHLIDRVLLLAHNPGITDAFYKLAKVAVDNVPTAGVGCFTLHSDSFIDLEEKEVTLDYFLFPKGL